jgi:hypothetical protein
VDVERTAPRARPRQWRDIIASALAEHEAISVRGTVISHLRRTPTRAEITAARRAAHRLAANGQATILHIRPHGLERVGGSAYLILARPGADPPSGLLDQLAATTHFEESTRIRFEPAVMAQELATSVELLAAAIQASRSSRPVRRQATDHRHRETARNPATNQTSPQTDLINACPSCAACICASFARVSVNRDEVVLCSCSRNRILALVIDWISASTRAPARPPCGPSLL